MRGIYNEMCAGVYTANSQISEGIDCDQQESGYIKIARQAGAKAHSSTPVNFIDNNQEKRILLSTPKGIITAKKSSSYSQWRLFFCVSR